MKVGIFFDCQRDPDCKEYIDKFYSGETIMIDDKPFGIDRFESRDEGVDFTLNKLEDKEDAS